MKCKLTDARHKMWPGRTFFTTSNDGEMLPTAVYMPPNHVEASRILNVLLYFHGWYVGSQEDLINNDKSRLCEQVINSGRDVVLVAPFLGSKWAKGDGKALHTDRFGQAGYGERFLKAILDALGAAISASAAPKRVPGVDAISGAGPIVGPFQIKNLVIACHSGGGVAMRNVVQTLGQFESSLRECIGLDCLYESGDAKFWFDRAKKPGTPLACFVFGPSTRWESIKLYLMAKGRADALGNELNPAAPALANLIVRPGHIPHFGYGGVTTNVTSAIDRVMDDAVTNPPAAPAKGKPPSAKGTAAKSFVDQAVDNFDANYFFPSSFLVSEEQGGIHYLIAREFLRDGLSSVSL
jgi:hypothetical protein